MKKSKPYFKNPKNWSNILASFALFFAILGANTFCCCIYHQPLKPDLRKLRKF